MNTINSVTPSPQSATSPSTGTYDDVKFLRSRLTPDAAGKVNEEQLFAGIIEERIKISVGTPVAAKFQALFQTARAQIGNRANATENAARRALQTLIRDGSLTKQQALKIHSEAFAAAQLDKNQEVLFDSTGGKKDRSVAVAAVDDAVARAIRQLNAFDSGKAVATTRPIVEVK